MTNLRPAFQFLYANPKNDLPNLRAEFEAHDHIFSPAPTGRLLNFRQYPNFGKEKIDRLLDQEAKHLTVLHFSGHAGQEVLEGYKVQVFLDGLVPRLKETLRHSHRLVLVFLNGCNTFKLATELNNIGVPVVIGTKCPVDDKLAADFSERFYQKFVSERATILEAYNSAVDFIKTTDNTLQFYRSIVGLSKPKEEIEESDWGIYYKQGHARFADWRLPNAREFDNLAEEKRRFVVNEYLQQVLIDTLLQPIGTETQTDLVGKLLEKFPPTLKNDMEVLLRYDPNEPSPYQTISPERLYQLVKVYQHLSEIQLLISLSQLWDAFQGEQGELILPEKMEVAKTALSEEFNMVHQYLTTPKKERRYWDFVPRLRAVRAIFDALELPYPLEELKKLSEEFDAVGNFTKACKGMGDLLSQLDQHLVNLSNPTTLTECCEEAEENLAHFLQAVAFCVRYQMVAVRNIELWMNRNMKKPIYSIRYFLGGALSEEKFRYDDYTCPRSVVLVKIEDLPLSDNARTSKRTAGANKRIVEKINLSPFVIDLNCGARNLDTKEVLRVFSHYQNKVFHYVSAVNPDNFDSFDERAPEYEEIEHCLGSFIQLFSPAQPAQPNADEINHQSLQVS